MPPPPDLHPRNGKPRTASSSILSLAFRSLTGPKTKDSVGSSLTPATNSHRTSDSLGRSRHRSLRNDITEPGSITQAAAIVQRLQTSDPDVLRGVLERLQEGHGLKDRIKAAKSLVAILQEYRVDNVGSIWQRAADMLELPADSTATRAAIELLEACLCYSELQPLDKRILFDTLARERLATSDSVEYLSILTRNGRDFESLDMSRVVKLISKLNKTLYDATIEARKRIKTDKAGSSAEEYQHLLNMFVFMTDAVKFSATVFTEDQLGQLLDFVIVICKRTSIEAILEQALDFVEVVIIYSALPDNLLKPWIELLLGIYCSIETLQSTAKRVLWSLLNSHMAAEVENHMLSILANGPQPTEYAANVARGTIMVFHEIIKSDEDEEDSVRLRPDLGAVLESLLCAVDTFSASRELETLRLLRTIVTKHSTSANIFDASVWHTFAELLAQCVYGEAADRIESAQQTDSSVSLLANLTPLEGGFQMIVREIRQALLALISEDANFTRFSHDSERASAVMSVLLRISRHLDESTLRRMLEYHKTERLHIGPGETWIETCRYLRKGVLEDEKRPLELRLLVLAMLYEAYNTALALGLRESERLLLTMLKSLRNSHSTLTLQPLANIVVDVVVWTDNVDLFDTVVQHLHDVVKDKARGLQMNPNNLTASPNVLTKQLEMKPLGIDTPSTIITKALIRIFLRTVNTSAAKSKKVYDIMLQLVKSQEAPVDARIALLKLLFRLRSDINHAIFVTTNTESESLAAALCRTEESASQEHGGGDSIKGWREEGRTTAKSATSSMSRANSSAGRPQTGSPRTQKATPTLWFYPGPNGLPEEPPMQSSYFVFSLLKEEHAGPLQESRAVIDIASWLDVVIGLIDSTSDDWEIFSYVIVHLGAQLSNHSLFANALNQIKTLRRLVCDKLTNRQFMDPPPSSNLKKSDVASCFFQILTIFLSYAQHFSKDEEQDAMIKAFVLGIGSWERTSEICIHGLSICCHEMPLSLVRYLETALQRMTQIITQTNVAASVLEFLTNLARLPELFRNFRDQDFRTVFGICFRYLQFVRDQKGKSALQVSRTGKATVTGPRISRDANSSIERLPYKTPTADALPQYVYALAHHVMTYWFMALKLPDRPAHIPWIVQNLVYTDEKGTELMEEQGQVTIDMMYRVAYTDRDETKADSNFASDADGAVSAKDYLVGMSILTVETAGRTGLSQITSRRPSGTSHSILAPAMVISPRHQAAMHTDHATEIYHSNDYVGMTPDHIVQGLYSPYTTLRFGSEQAAPIPLPKDDATRRAIATFDRTPALDGHRIGIIYVGESQIDEVVILANVMGSADYMAFLNGIGSLTELKGATFNTQGLDRESDLDGKYTYCWRDRVSEIVFHVTTMMPTNLEHYPHCDNKKRHTGNDFVNVIFNNSGLPFQFDTFPSEFNYVNIVITPEARTSFVETRLHESHGSSYYKVSVMSKLGLPQISPAADTKIISREALPAFVRLLALNASVFCQVWANRDIGEYVSSWRNRLREIGRLRQRHQPVNKPDKGPGSLDMTLPGTSMSHPDLNTTQNGNNLLRRMSAATFSDISSTNRLSGLSTADEADRSSSLSSHERTG